MSPLIVTYLHCLITMKRTFENLILEPANAAHITAPKKRKKGKKEKRKKGKKGIQTLTAQRTQAAAKVQRHHIQQRAEFDLI